MGRTRKPIVEKTVRIQEDQVTHELVVTKLDAVEKARQRIIAAIDRERILLSNADAEELARRVQAELAKMIPYN